MQHARHDDRRCRTAAAVLHWSTDNLGVTMAATRRPPSPVLGREPGPAKPPSPRSLPPKPPRPGATSGAPRAKAPASPTPKVGAPRPNAKARSLPPPVEWKPQPRPSKGPSPSPSEPKLGSAASPKRPPPLPGARLQPPPFPGSLRPNPPAVSRERSRSLVPKAGHAASDPSARSRSNSMVPNTLKPAKR